MIEAKACGKLYWAGEYAVIEPNNTAIIKSVKKYLGIKIKRSSTLGQIHTGLSNRPVRWFYKGNHVHFEKDDDSEYIYNTISVMSEYATSLGRELECFDLSVSSELKNSANAKYGFGSSAAIIVAIVKAMNELYSLKLNKLEIFKLACIVSLQMGSNSSMGDVAAVVYDDLIAYTSFDRAEIRERLNNTSLYDLVHSEWNYLNIEVLENKLAMECLVGWTKEVAVSSQFVRDLQIHQNSAEYRQFLKCSATCVTQIKQAITHNQKEVFLAHIEKNRQLLADLGKLIEATIETEKLQRLVAIAQKHGEVAKLSGAGGGDCGIAFVFNKENEAKIIKAWENEDILFLGRH